MNKIMQASPDKLEQFEFGNIIKSKRDKFAIFCIIPLLFNLFYFAFYNNNQIHPFYVNIILAVLSAWVILTQISNAKQMNILYFGAGQSYNREVLIRIAVAFCWACGLYTTILQGIEHTVVSKCYFELSVLLALYLRLSVSIDVYILSRSQKNMPVFCNGRTKRLGHADNLCRLLVILVVFYVCYQIIQVFIFPNNMNITKILATLLVVSPSALYFSLKIPLLKGIKALKKHGVSIKKIRLLFMLNLLDTIVFNSVYALTKGNRVVSDIYLVSDLNETQLLSLALSLEIKADDSIAKILCKKAKQENCQPYEVEMFQKIEGYGLRAKCQGKWLIVGNIKFMEQSHINIENRLEVNSELSIEESLVYLAFDNELRGIFRIKDVLRSDAKQSLAELYKLNLQVKIMTGHKERQSCLIAEQLELHEKIHANLLPHQKQKSLQCLIDGGHHLAVVSSTLETKLLNPIDLNQITLTTSLPSLSHLPKLIRVARNIIKKQAKLLTIAILYQLLGLFFVSSDYWFASNNVGLVLMVMLFSLTANLYVILSS